MGRTITVSGLYSGGYGSSLAGDPLLPEVAWDWLTEGLSEGGAEYSNLGGTVTSTASVRFGEITGPPSAYQIEMRASWTAASVELAPHVVAFQSTCACGRVAAGGRDRAE